GSCFSLSARSSAGESMLSRSGVDGRLVGISLNIHGHRVVKLIFIYTEKGRHCRRAAGYCLAPVYMGFFRLRQRLSDCVRWCMPKVHAVAALVHQNQPGPAMPAGAVPVPWSAPAPVPAGTHK